MAASQKFSVTLPPGLFRALERLRREVGLSRSGLIARSVELLLREARRTARERTYVDGYRRSPETPSEVAASEAAAVQLLAGEPW